MTKTRATTSSEASPCVDWAATRAAATMNHELTASFLHRCHMTKGAWCDWLMLVWLNLKNFCSSWIPGMFNLNSANLKIYSLSFQDLKCWFLVLKGENRSFQMFLKIKITHFISALKYSVLKSQRLFEFKVRWKRWTSINFWVTSCKLPAAKFQVPLQLPQFARLKYRNNYCQMTLNVIEESLHFISLSAVFFFLFQWSFFSFFTE